MAAILRKIYPTHMVAILRKTYPTHMAAILRKTYPTHTAVILRKIYPGDPGEVAKTMRISYTYILASQRNGTLYVGVTANLIKRVYEHKAKIVKGFTFTYSVDKLVYFEEFSHISEAIHS